MTEKSVSFRKFEERDIDFVYKCKNDKKLNSLVVGNWHPLSYSESSQWVRNCMKGDRQDLKYWAICTNDIERRIIGWTSLSEINIQNSSACQHGIFIGDANYNDGTAMFESLLFTMEYAFDILKLHRLYGSCLSAHKVSPHMLFALGFRKEGEHIDAVKKNNIFYSVLDFSILNSEYETLLRTGMYDISVLSRKFVQSVKSSKK